MGSKSDLAPCTFSFGNYVIGFDPGVGDEKMAACVMRRESDGKITILDTQEWSAPGDEKPTSARHVRRSNVVVPLHFTRECRVCENDRHVFVGGGAQTDMIECPACIGVRRESLGGFEVVDVMKMCALEGVPVRWL